MENRFEHSQPEEQGWGAYVTPPRYTGPEHTEPSVRRTQTGLCARVVEMLPALLENDGDIRPEMATAIYSHLAVCPHCAREFDEMQRVVKIVEALAPAEMPMDFSGLIMQRIQNEMGPARNGPQSRPTVAASSQGLGEVAAKANPPIADPLRAAVSLQAAELREFQTDALHAGLKVEGLTQTHAWERLTLVGALSAVLAFFLTTNWGQEMLRVNVETVGAWLSQVGAALKRVPGLSMLVTFIFSALAQVGDMLGETYRTLGATAAKGLALDVALCAGVYYLFYARSRRGQVRGI